jgi:hypothetical protein
MLRAACMQCSAHQHHGARLALVLLDLLHLLLHQDRGAPAVGVLHDDASARVGSGSCGEVETQSFLAGRAPIAPDSWYKRAAKRAPHENVACALGQKS